MPTSDRQLRWPRFANQARRRTEETAEDYAELMRHALELTAQIQTFVHTDPHLAEQLTIRLERDIALTIAAFTDIRSWMRDAARGRGDGEA